MIPNSCKRLKTARSKRLLWETQTQPGKLLPRTILGVADELTVRPPEGNEVAVEPLAGDVAVHAKFLHAVVASVEGLGVETEDPPATDT